MLIGLATLISTLVFLKGAESTLSNVTPEKATLPEINNGDKCTYGKKYRMDCNTCYCGHQNNLICTKTACLNQMQSEIHEHAPKVNKRSKVDNEKVVKKKKKARKIVRRENTNPQNTASSGFPALPKNKTCTPGRIYQEGCQRCFCNTGRKAECSTVNACKQLKVKRDLEPVDVRPEIKDQEFKELPELPHAATPCTPGTTYKVDCNGCICDEFQNLLCDKLLCISFTDMHRAEALKKSGLPCNIENFVENDVIQSECVQCACNGTTYCQAKEDCMAVTEKMLRTRSNGSSLAFNYMKEKCVPERIYKENCNKCYCQDDQTLRCTQKTCLNYKQAVMLERQQKYLQEHGL